MLLSNHGDRHHSLSYLQTLVGPVRGTTAPGIFAFLLVCLAGQIHGQELDSLLLTLSKENNDTARVELFMNLANAEYQAHPDAAFDYSGKALRLATEINYHSGIADAHGWLAYLELNNRSNTGKARAHYTQALSIWTELGQQVGLNPKLDSIQVYQGISNSIINIGYLHELEMNFPLALENYLRGIELGRQYGLHEHVAACYMNVGSIRKHQGNVSGAIESYESAARQAREHGLNSVEAHAITATGQLWEDNGYLLKAKGLYLVALGTHRLLGDIVNVASCLNNLGSVEQESGRWSEALLYYDSAAVMALGVGNLRSYCTYLNNAGSALSFLEKDKEALLKYDEALRVALDKQFSEVPALVLNNAARSYMKLGNIPRALRDAQHAHRLSFEDGILLQQLRSVELLAKLYAQVGRLREAYDMRVMQSQFTDSLQGEKISRLIARSVVAEDIRKEALRDSLVRTTEAAELENEMTLAHLISRRRRNTTLAIANTSVLLLVGVGIALTLDRKRRKARHARKAAFLQTQAWRAQVNPHFIHTALQNINEYVVSNERDLASSFLTRFARLMRAVLENARKDEVPLAADLAVMRDYLDLEKIRMKDRFSYTIEVESAIDVEEVVVPPMLLQPFAEEAIWQGLANNEQPGQITIRIRQQGRALVLSLEDNRSMREASTENEVLEQHDTTSGTTITRARLELLAEVEHRPATVHTIPLAQGRRVEVQLPWMTAA